MSGCGEVLDDFSMRNSFTTAENLVGACRSESTNGWTASSGITSKNPPANDGTTSWFKCEELIEDWIDLTVLETSKQSPALTNRLYAIAENYKPLLSREALRAEDGVKYFRDKLRPHFVNGAYSVFLWRFCSFIRARIRNTEMVDWIGKFDLLLKRVKDSWMDMLPLSSMTEQQRESQ